MKTTTRMKKPEMKHNEFTIESAYAAIDLHLLKLPEQLQRDRDDLRQDILLAVMERAVEYDPSLSSVVRFTGIRIGSVHFTTPTLPTLTAVGKTVVCVR